MFRGVMTWVQADRNQVKPWVRAITGVHGAHFIDYFGTPPWAGGVDVGDEEHFAIEWEGVVMVQGGEYKFYLGKH